MVVAVIVVVAAAAAVEAMVVVTAAVAKVLVEKETEGKLASDIEDQQSTGVFSQRCPRIHPHCRESCMDHILGLKKGDKRPGEEGPKGTNRLVVSFSLPTT